jgi:hypothetical protein
MWLWLWLWDINLGTWPNKVGESHEAVKYGLEFCRIFTQEWLLWQGPEAIVQLNFRPILSSERVPHVKKPAIVKQKTKIWSLAPNGSPTTRQTGQLTVSHNLTWTWTWIIRKACGGIYGIPNECLRHLPRRCLVHLTHLINHRLPHSHFPTALKDVTIITLQKPCNDSKFPLNLRLISLLSMRGKLFEGYSKNSPKEHWLKGLLNAH